MCFIDFCLAACNNQELDNNTKLLWKMSQEKLETQTEEKEINSGESPVVGVLQLEEGH